MSVYMGKCWKCDTCGFIDNNEPWDCPVCGKEVCESCFEMYMICKDCADGKTHEEVKIMSEKLGYEWDE